MRGEIEEVLSIQPSWTKNSTPAMVRRSQLVNHAIPAMIRSQLPSLAGLVPGATDDIAVRGSGGAGGHARVPWTRVYSASRSPGASEGWYVVLLFAADGGTAYLSLNQGSTRWAHGNYDSTLSVGELAARAVWARSQIANELTERSDFDTEIDLAVGARDLGARYEAGNVAAFRYPRDEIPVDEAIEADLRFLVQALGHLYLADDVALQLPGGPDPDVADATTAAERVANPLGKRVRFRVSQAERVAIERRAVDVAMADLESDGFTKVKYVGDKQTHDVDANLGDLRIYVEVKGTTSTGETVVLTRNEVEVYQREHPATMLVVVHGIILDRSADPPVASGGHVRRIYPWTVSWVDLEALAYRYATPLEL